mgnify:CR=1 FL=1
MKNKPLYYDGSVPHVVSNEQKEEESSDFEITDEMRKNLAGNPYSLEEK